MGAILTLGASRRQRNKGEGGQSLEWVTNWFVCKEKAPDQIVATYEIIWHLRQPQRKCRQMTVKEIDRAPGNKYPQIYKT